MRNDSKKAFKYYILYLKCHTKNEIELKLPDKIVYLCPEILK